MDTTILTRNDDSPRRDLDLTAMDAIVARLRAAQAVQIVGHVRPDGDCIGSMLAMHHLLNEWGIRNAIAARLMPTNGYDALPDFGLIRDTADADLKPDLVVFVDCATQDRALENWTPPAPVINIDHHESNTRFGELNWVDPRSAATGEMLYYLVRQAGAMLSPVMAEALLVALTTDTGSFRFTNTGPAQHLVAARLLEAGADISRIYRIVYGSHACESVQLTGHVLSNLRLACGDTLVWSEVRDETYKLYGGEKNAPENLADALRGIRGVKVSLLFHEMPDGALRVNLRSNGEVNVGKLAARWGGGGHPSAAGIYLNHADYEKDRDRILDAIMGEITQTGQACATRHGL